MRSAPVRPTVRLAVTAILAAAGIALLPGWAAAGCGDYVVVRGRTEAGHASPTLPPKPCHGPGCTNRPTAPFLPSTVPVTTPTEQQDWATPSSDEGETGCRPGWTIPPTTGGRAVSRPGAVFHPPRVG